MADPEEIYEVEQILAKRRSRRGIEYLIRWKGFDNSWDTWEPVANLGEAMDIVVEFNEKQAMKQLVGGIKGKTKGVKRTASLSPPGGIAKRSFPELDIPISTPPTSPPNNKLFRIKGSPKSPRGSRSPPPVSPRASISPPPVEQGPDSQGSVKVKGKRGPKPKDKTDISKGKTVKQSKTKVMKPKVVSTKAGKNTKVMVPGKVKRKYVRKKGVVKPTEGEVIPGTEAVQEKSKTMDLAKDVSSETVEIPKVKPVQRQPKVKNEKIKGLKTKGITGKGKKQLAKEKVPRGRKRKAEETAAAETDTSDDDNILYSLNEDPQIKEETPDPEVSFQCIVSPAKKILLKDSVKPKTKIVKPVPRMPVSPSRVRSPIFLNDVPASPYKTPPSSPSSLSPATNHQGAVPVHGREAPHSYISDLPAVPVIPIIPSSPSAASYKKVLATSYPPDTHRGYASHTVHEDKESPESVERRMSVRQSECAFRYKEVVVRKCPGYTQVWLFTQTKLKNALNPNVLSELKQVLHNAKHDDSRLVMISGSGSVFCSGVDLHYLQTGDRRQAAKNMADAIREFISVVISFPKMIVAAVNGPAVGLGATMLPLFDIIYASDKASFYCPYARLAQTPEACASYTFPLIMGNAMANEMLLAGRKLTAIEAYQIGIVSQVFWPTSMMQQVMPRVHSLAMHSAKALEQSKMLVRNHQKAKLEFTNESECQLLLERWSTGECHKAIKDYLDDEHDILV